MSARIERRTIPLSQLGGIEIRKAEQGDGRILAGHAAVFNSRTEIWGFTEEVQRGAFKQTVKEDDIRALFNHNPDYVLGRNTSKTMRLKEDDVGLYFEVDLPDTQVARDLVVSIERGDITGCSFGFMVRAEEWKDEKNAMPHRTLTDCQLFDVGPVTFPAYRDTDVEARSLYEAMVAERAKPPVPAPDFSLELRRRKLALTELE